MKHSKSTQQCGHFALRTVRIGCGSSENENKTVQILVFSEFVIVTFSKVRNSLHIVVRSKVTTMELQILLATFLSALFVPFNCRNRVGIALK